MLRPSYDSTFNPFEDPIFRCKVRRPTRTSNSIRCLVFSVIEVYEEFESFRIRVSCMICNFRTTWSLNKEDSSSSQSALTIEASHFVPGLHFLHDYRRLEGCHLDQRVPGRLHVLLLPHRRHHRRVRRRRISRSFQVRSWSRPEIQSTNQLIRTGDSTLNQIST